MNLTDSDPTIPILKIGNTFKINCLVQDRSNEQTTPANSQHSQQLKQLSKSSSHLKVTNLRQVSLCKNLPLQ
ncbi:hypothetical protein BGS_0191 [Beggiatoa sp. SS]|nr:hypothetical protein BGS_0191 [Beggiatoa sp. SS]